MQTTLLDTLLGLLSNPVFYLHITWVLAMSASVVWFLYRLHNLSQPEKQDRRRMAWLAGAATAGVLNFGLPTYWAL
jgi:heme A synthase